MARPRQDGLLYFSFDTDFFYADQRIKRLHSRYGSDGMLFYIYLLTEIYRNGYYIKWDGESVENAMDDLHLKEGLIEQVMTFLVSRSLLCKSTLANSDTIITSPGIQKRYQEAVKGRKRQIEVDSEINDKDLIHIGNLEFNVISTPGHTSGGICIYSEAEKIIFSGDTLFCGALGRTDLPTSSYKDIINSVKNKLFLLPDETIVYPGHGRPTTIGEEKNNYDGF